MTTVLKPYADWLKNNGKGKRARILHRGNRDQIRDAKAFEPYFKHREKLGRFLGEAKRFICPIDLLLTKPGSGDGVGDAAPYLERNPHLPYPVVYLQVELTGTVEDTGEERPPLWVLYLLRELGPHEFEGMYAAWDPKHPGETWEKPFRLRYSPDGCEHVPLGPIANPDGFDVLELMMTLPLMCVDEINRDKSGMEHHAGRAIIGSSGIRKGEKIEYTKLIDLSRGTEHGGESSGEGSKKKEHDVRGHWRHLKHGRVVWVRSHKRGDAELGTVDSDYLTHA